MPVHDEALEEAFAELIAQPLQRARVSGARSPSQLDLEAEHATAGLDDRIHLALARGRPDVHHVAADVIGLGAKLLHDVRLQEPACGRRVCAQIADVQVG